MAAAADLRQVGLADALSLCLLLRDDDPLRYDRAAVRWLVKFAEEDRRLTLAEVRQLDDILDGLGRHEQVAKLRLERLLRARGFQEAADRLG